MRLASVYQLIAVQMALELLNHFDTQLEVVGGVGVDQLADLLPFVRALLYHLAVVLKKMADEKLVEIGRCRVFVYVLVDLDSQHFAEYQGVGKRVLDWGESAEYHRQEGVERCQLSA